MKSLYYPLIFLLILSSCSKNDKKEDAITTDEICLLNKYEMSREDGANVLRSDFTYTYDDNQNLKSINAMDAYHEGRYTGKAFFVYSSDQAVYNNFKNEKEWEFTLDNTGKITLGKHNYENEEFENFEFSYNGEGYLSEIKVYDLNPKELSSTTKFEYSNGNLVKETFTEGSYTETTSFVYDLTKSAIPKFDYILNNSLFNDGSSEWDEAMEYPLIFPSNLFGKTSKNLLKSAFIKEYDDTINLEYNFNSAGNPSKITSKFYWSMDFTYQCK